jgi:hypothetical protein
MASMMVTRLSHQGSYEGLACAPPLSGRMRRTRCRIRPIRGRWRITGFPSRTYCRLRARAGSGGTCRMSTADGTAYSAAPKGSCERTAGPYMRMRSRPTGSDAILLILSSWHGSSKASNSLCSSCRLGFPNSSGWHLGRSFASRKLGSVAK